MKFVLLILSLAFVSLSQAETICTGKIERLGFSPTSGDVHLQIQPSTGIFRVCNLDGAVGGISEEACKSMYSTLLAARVSEKEVSLYYADSVSCESLGSWNYPSSAPYFFEIEKNF